MEASWSDTTIGSQVVLQRGFDITKAEQRDGVVPVVSSGGVSSYHDTAMVKRPGVVLGRKGTLGSVFYIDQDHWPHDTTLWVKDFKGNLPRFVYYFFKSMSAELLALDNATANPALNRNHVHPIRVLWPSVPIQKSIVALLGALDDKIELNRKVNRALEALASALFKSWFVDFDPVVAKRDGKALVGVPADAVDLFPSHFEDSGLGSFPKGWTAGRVDDQFLVAMGQSPPGSTYNQTGQGVPFYQGRTDFGFRFPTRRVYCTAPTRIAERTDALISVRAPVGDVNMAAERCAIGRGVAAVRHKAGQCSFGYYAMRSLRDEFDVYESEGTLFGAIRGTDFRTLRLTYPSEKVLNCFESIARPLDDQVALNEQESATLAALRDTLLPGLLSGEVTLKATEKTVAEVV